MLKESMDPKKIVLRESCDSEENPNSTAIIIGLDVTGSMGLIAERMAKKELGTLIEGILDRKPIPDPHIMIMGIGDVRSDRAPLQASQFEADIRIAQQLSELYLEGGGGGNDSESYDLPWYFAATKTKIDCYDKREKKGYLFTIGDEMPPYGVELGHLRDVFGKGSQSGYTAKELLDMASEKYQVFHVVVEQGSFASRALKKVNESWKKLLGKRALPLNDYNHLSQVILSAIEVSEGKDPEEVVASWEDKSVQKSVKYALGMTIPSQKKNESGWTELTVDM
jgi:hypothetical protein